ncbi:uncharacterized protein LOC126480439 isoform X8 [Schistocerca serialis cubense]|uniref:uncharacterized protein LOC126480439 isoform X8 n=1 Tax=Schistocerca serialis cubense TaxID=2023355 RepID=UPI00214F433B|nr:uncharacterized protein LOC126480439 isoform X8 [Schistocerca serialis cubense]
MGHCLPPTCRSVPAESTRSDAITSSSEPKPGTLAVEGNSTKRGRRHSTLDLKMESDALLEMNQMELRSGRNLIKCAAADSMELAGTSISSKETIQTPVRKSFRTKRSIGREKENEEPGAPFISVENFPDRKSSQRKSNKRKSKWEEENEGMAITSPLAENVQIPNSGMSLTKKRRKSMQIVNEQPGTPTISTETTQTPTRKSIHIKRSVGKEEQNDEPDIPCILVEDSPDGKSGKRKTNKRSSKLEEQNEGTELSDLAPPLQECGTSSTHMTENVERNDELLVPTTDQNEEDIAEILNSTFEVAEQDSILQTPARKRSVRFAAAVETASFSSSVDSTPKFSTPVSVNSKQRSSHYKGTPHPSVKKRPASILKTSSSKKFPSSSKDTSLKGKGSARKMPDFNSIHKAQFEKMESIVDFSHRRQKCVRKLEDQAVDGNDKEIQLKPFAVVKPVEKRARNAVSRIPVAPQNTSRHGTPRALSSSHIPVASFHVLKEKNFDARLSAPHTINSRPSSAKMGNNSRPKPLNNLKPQRITYEQAKATIQNKKPLAAVKREAERLENRNILKGVRLNRRFELQMQHRKLNV